MGATTDRYVVISADCHGGASVLGYKPFLASKLPRRFDRWAADFENPYDDNIGRRRRPQLELRAPAAGDGGRRRRRRGDLPQHRPAVLPEGLPRRPAARARPTAISPSGGPGCRRTTGGWPTSAARRRAGAPASRRSCCTTSTRRCREIEWAKANGLTGGILLPGAPPGSGVPPLYAPDYEPIWAACEDLGMPINHHSGSAVPDMGPYPAAQMMFLLEVTWWAHRTLWHLIYSGVMERHPTLQFVFTEQGTAWIPEELTRLDYYRGRLSGASGAGGSQEAKFGAGAVEQLSLSPSEYWHRQCHLGSSFIRRHEVAMREQVGVDRIMWGSDFPHLEGCWPFSRTHLRTRVRRRARGRGPADGRAQRGRRLRLRLAAARDARRPARPHRRRGRRAARRRRTSPTSRCAAPRSPARSRR